MEILKYKFIKSPVGALKLVANDKALLAILWDNETYDRVRLDQMEEDKNHPLILETEKQLNEYFQNKRTEFDVPLEAHGTSFQKGVWKLLQKIPYGTTWSYKDIAVKMNSPQGFRAVGAACGRNPISIIIPCHRVVATNGKLTGFAGGVDRKKILLDFESTK